MRRFVAWLCLIIALAGPLASQARIAYGLLLSRSEIGLNILESGQEVDDEEYDGRDMVAVFAHFDAGPVGSIDLSLPLDLSFLIPAPITSPSESREAGRCQSRWKWPPPTARERCALLQTLLI